MADLYADKLEIDGEQVDLKDLMAQHEAKQKGGSNLILAEPFGKRDLTKLHLRAEQFEKAAIRSYLIVHSTPHGRVDVDFDFGDIDDEEIQRIRKGLAAADAHLIRLLLADGVRINGRD